ADQVRQRLPTNLRAEALLDHLGRHLAGPETFQPHVAAHLGDALAHARLELLGRESDRQLALQLAGIFELHLHRCSVVRKVGLEPTRCYPPEPKSGASTSSATFARGVERTTVAIIP